MDELRRCVGNAEKTTNRIIKEEKETNVPCSNYNLVDPQLLYKPISNYRDKRSICLCIDH